MSKRNNPFLKRTTSAPAPEIVDDEGADLIPLNENFPGMPPMSVREKKRLAELEDVLDSMHPIRDITERATFAGIARFLSLLEDQPNEFILFAGIHLNTPSVKEDSIIPVAGVLGTSGKIIETGDNKEIFFCAKNEKTKKYLSFEKV